MRRRHRGRAGVTLIELLIAVTLVSMLSVGILYAMRVGLVTLERTNDKLFLNRRVLGARNILEQQVANLMVVKTVCNGPRDDLGNGTIPFFHGEPAALRFVSRYSIQHAARGSAHVLEYTILPGDQGVGVRLVVNEYPYTGPVSVDPLCVGLEASPMTGQMTARYLPIQTGPGSFILADKLRHCRFAYQVIDRRSGQRVWSPVFSGTLPPAAIRIEMAPLEPDASRAQFGTLTIPVNVFRNPAVVYKDVDDQETQYQ